MGGIKRRRTFIFLQPIRGVSNTAGLYKVTIQIVPCTNNRALRFPLRLTLLMTAIGRKSALPPDRKGGLMIWL